MSGGPRSPRHDAPGVAEALEERLLAAYVGPSWAGYYRTRFARMRRDPGMPVGWNWAAALVPFWPVFRRLRLAVLVYIPAGLALPAVSEFWQGYTDQYVYAALLTVGAGTGVVEGLFGTWALFVQARGAARRAGRRSASPEEALTRVRRGSPLLQGAVSLLLLALAALLAGFGHSTDKAYLAAMKSDLRTVAIAQEEFRATHGRYAATPSELRLEPTSQVTLRIIEGTAEGFSAVATHAWIRDRCLIYVGTAQPPFRAMTPGEPLCARRAP